MPGILEGKKILVTGVLTPASIAFAIAQEAQNEGHHPRELWSRHEPDREERPPDEPHA